MRLHRLEITGFGPFAQQQVIDLDELTAAGLFLLHGPTGAGKTSVLDAICFALYGRVPGARCGGGRYRSDHADATLTTRVICEFTVSGRRLEISRSPEWQRPKKRGAGLTREPARVVVREHTADGWVGLTHRMDEAGELIGRLVGLGPDQFTQLILLPQGEFAAFLRASPEQRRPLLQKLFGTDRFAAVEQHLAERRRSGAAAVATARERTGHLLARAQEARAPATEPDPATNEDAPTDPGQTDPGQPDPGQPDAGQPAPGRTGPARRSQDEPDLDAVEAVADLVARWARQAQQARHDAQDAARTADLRQEQARAAHDALTERIRRRDRARELTAEIQTLLAAADDQETRRERLLAATRAQTLHPLLESREQAREQLDHAEALLRSHEPATTAALRETDGVPETGSGETERAPASGAGPVASPPFDDEPGTVHDRALRALSDRIARVRARIGALAALLPAQDELAELDRGVDLDRRRLTEARATLAQSEQGVRDLGTQVPQLRALVAGLEQQAAGLADRTQDVDRARRTVEAVATCRRLEQELTEHRDRLRAMTDAHQDAVAAGQRLQARRLAQMAAELAAGLIPGTACPVCGAAEHPAPAPPAPDPVTEQAQQQAADLERQTAAQRERARQAVEETDRRLAAATALTGGLDEVTAADELDRALTRLSVARQAVQRRDQAAAELTRAQSDLERDQARVGEGTDAVIRAGQELADRSGRRDELRNRLRTACGDEPDVRTGHDRLSAALRVLTAQESALQAVQAAHHQLVQAEQSLEKSCSEAGFGDVQQAGAARLPEPELAALTAAVTAYEAALTGARARLADLPAEPAPQADLDRLRADARTADELDRAEHRLAQERHTLATRAARALTGLAADLRDHAARTASLRAGAATLEALSRCLEGTGADNRLRMRLSSYVLAARLEQVAQTASERLAGMTGGRYTLVHTDGPARSGARSGLGLAVVDAWTGAERDPATLSGGETFCASLALALGLADVVQAEAGGAVIETLLVDEGFGSLDADTLDEVMDVLDGLRSGGRCVGLVSHVPDLRDRIPAQLEVVKTRTGSQLRVCTPSAVGAGAH